MSTCLNALAAEEYFICTSAACTYVTALHVCVVLSFRAQL